MSIDSMRMGGGRCPPLLVGGLIVACIMMVCNWWTLSSTNYELARQIDELTEELKISGKERDECMTKRTEVDKEINEYKDDVRTTHVKLSQVEDAMSTCNKEIESYKSNDLFKTATLEALRLDKKATEAQLEEQKEANKKLKDELQKVKDEFEKVKLSMNAPQQKQQPSLPIASNTVISAPHLGPIETSAVHVSAWGQEGIHFHGVPILPQDPPGAVRLTPRFSITKLNN